MNEDHLSHQVTTFMKNLETSRNFTNVKKCQGFQ